MSGRITYVARLHRDGVQPGRLWRGTKDRRDAPVRARGYFTGTERQL